LKQNGVEVIDSGVGLAAPPQENDSFGLGLVLVKDICRQFSCDFELKGNNDGQGCVATITWS
jgi:two-component sensor histidine kinase